MWKQRKQFLILVKKTKHDRAFVKTKHDHHVQQNKTQIEKIKLYDMLITTKSITFRGNKKERVSEVKWVGDWYIERKRKLRERTKYDNRKGRRKVVKNSIPHTLTQNLGHCVTFFFSFLHEFAQNRLKSERDNIKADRESESREGFKDGG